jgi:hypothetical protein
VVNRNAHRICISDALPALLKWHLPHAVFAVSGSAIDRTAHRML